MKTFATKKIAFAKAINANKKFLMEENKQLEKDMLERKFTLKLT